MQRCQDVLVNEVEQDLSETAAHLLSRKWRWLAADSTPGVRSLGALIPGVALLAAPVLKFDCLSQPVLAVLLLMAESLMLAAGWGLLT